MWSGEMRRKQKITDDKEAVSAVIAVMLMVAIAVAMAAVAFAYLTGMIGGGNMEAAPIIDFTANYEANTLLITYSEIDIDWEDFRILGLDGDGETKYFQEGASGPRAGTAEVGEKVNINDDGSDDIDGTVVVTVTHIPSDTVMGEYTFEDVI